MQATETITLGSVQVDAAALAEICRRYQVRELALFGSAARGEMTPGSDLDLTAEFYPNHRIGLFEFESLVEELAALTGRTVDLGTKAGLKPWIRDHVLRELRVIYAA